MKSVTVLSLALILLPVAAAAQGPDGSAGPRRFPTFASTPVPPPLADTVMRIRPTHWVTGAAIGGTALGLLTGIMAVGLCGMSEDSSGPGPGGCFAAGLLLGGLTGGLIGALVGGQFPRANPGEEAPPATAP